MVLNNLLIETNNATHQIDHVVISRYGIFSIETKQYNGYITGNRINNDEIVLTTCSENPKKQLIINGILQKNN